MSRRAFCPVCQRREEASGGRPYSAAVLSGRHELVQGEGSSCHSSKETGRFNRKANGICKIILISLCSSSLIKVSSSLGPGIGKLFLKEQDMKYFGFRGFL